MVGASAHLVGNWTLQGLFGRALEPALGGLEGMALGASTGLGYALATRRDELRLATVNTVQEVLDVVEVTDPQAGLTAAPRRVRAIRWRYAGAGPKPRYDMTLTLGQP